VSSDCQSPAPPARANVVWHAHAVTRKQREQRNGHCGALVWLTGLPGSGKSTIAHAVEAHLHRAGWQTVVLDGDNLRHGLCADLGFSLADRNENVRRAGELAKVFVELGVVVIVALVSPVRRARDSVRTLLPERDFLEIYCRCAIPTCKERDPKGMYAKAESGAIPEFTGISSPYEAPLDPELILDTDQESAEQSVQRLTEFFLGRIGASD
jgi:adenylylsulfate kinase